MNQPFVSIIVPAYCVEQYIRPCLENLQNQTLQNIEILLIDDGSTDATGRICDEFAAKDARFRVVHQKNGGVSSARNTALALCTGEYIGFVDADDSPAWNMFECLYRAAKDHNCDAAICEFARIGDGTRISLVESEKPQQILNRNQAIELVSDFNKNILVALWNKIIRRELVQDLRFDTNKFVSEDMEFLLLSLLRVQKAVYLPTPLYGYLAQRSGSAMDRKSHSLDWYYKQCEFMEDIMNKVAAIDPSLRSFGTAYVCANSYMAMANAMAFGNALDKPTLAVIRKKLRANLFCLMRAKLHLVKKVQILVLLSNWRLYCACMKRKG